MCELADFSARQWGQNGVTASGQMLRLAHRGSGAKNAVKLVELALTKGINLIDVTDVVEVEGLGEFIQSRRKELVLALRFGVRREDGSDVPDSSRDSIRRVCDNALDRLGVDSVDLLFQEAADPETPIDDVAEELKALISAGRVRVAGLAPEDGASLRRGCAILPLAVVAMNWSVWSPKVNDELLNVCRELGVSVLANKALGGGRVRSVRFLDSAAVSEKVKQAVDNFHSKLLKRLQEINAHPKAFLGKRVKAIAGIQFSNLSKMITGILENQATVFAAKIKRHVEEQDVQLTTKLENMVKRQKEHAVGTMETLLQKQLAAFVQRAETFIGQPDGKLLQRVEKVMMRQQHVLVARVTHIRTVQNEKLLETLKAKLGNSSPAVKKISKCLSNNCCRLIARIYARKAGQTERLGARIQKIQERQKAATAVRVEVALQRQVRQLSKKIFNVLEKQRPMPPRIKNELEEQREKLAVKFHMLADRGAGPDRMKVALGKMMQKQASILLNEVEAVVKRRNESAGKICERVLGSEKMAAVAESGDGADGESVHTGTESNGGTKPEHAKMLAAISERVREVAKARHVGVNAVCIAWLHHHGRDVIPVAKLSGRGKCLDALLKGANLVLAPDELAKMSDIVLLPSGDESPDSDLEDWDDCEIAVVSS